MIMGKVEGWRYERRNAYMIYCALSSIEGRADMYALLPLPFDDELSNEGEMTTDVKVIEMYEYAKSTGYFDKKL